MAGIFSLNLLDIPTMATRKSYKFVDHLATGSSKIHKEHLDVLRHALICFPQCDYLIAVLMLGE